MIPIDRIRSTLDKTVKHVFFAAQNQIVEATYLNKNDGKDIVVVPSQTSCKLGCTFCFLTGSTAPARNLAAAEIVSATHDVLEVIPTRNDTLLVSYMGSGEPLVNLPGVIKSALTIRNCYRRLYKTVRFAVASIIPTVNLADEFSELVSTAELPFKFHFSLHSPFDTARQKLMPAAADIRASLDALAAYHTVTGNPVEIHYTLIADQNDRDEDLTELTTLLERRKYMTVKFLAFRPRPEDALVASPRLRYFIAALAASGIRTEVYDPPGSDINASCGQFLVDAERKRYLPLIKVT